MFIVIIPISENTCTFPLKNNRNGWRIRFSTTKALNKTSSLKETTEGEGQV